METQTVAAGQALAARRPVAWTPAVAFMFGACVLLWADRSNFSVAAAVWVREFGWTPGVTGAMLSAFSFGYLIAMPFGGVIVDRVGPRRVLAAACGGWSLFCLLTPLAPGLLWLTGAFRTLLGASEAPFLPATTAAVSLAIPRASRRGMFVAFIQSGSGLGPAIGTIAAGAIAHALGVPWIFILFGGVGVLLAVGWMLYAARRGEPAPSAVEAAQAEAQDRSAEAPVPLRKMLANRSVVVFALSYFAVPYATFLNLTWLPLYFTQYRGIHLVQASVLSAAPYLAGFVAANLVGVLSAAFAGWGWTWDGFHRKSLIVAGGLLYAVFILIAATTASATVAVVCIVVAGAGITAAAQPYWMLATDMAPRQSGSLSAVMNFCGIIGATLAPVLSGLMAQSTHAFVLPFEVSAAIFAVAALALLAFVRVRPLTQLVQPSP